MNTGNIVIEIDAEIARLQQARNLLTDTTGSSSLPAKKLGRPKGSGKAALGVNSVISWKPRKGAGQTHKLSVEGRKAISDAAKIRWAERKRSTK